MQQSKPPSPNSEASQSNLLLRRGINLQSDIVVRRDWGVGRATARTPWAATLAVVGEVDDTGVVLVGAVCGIILSSLVLTLLIRVVGIAGLTLAEGVCLGLWAVACDNLQILAKWVRWASWLLVRIWDRAIRISGVQLGATEKSLGLDLWLGVARLIAADATHALSWELDLGVVIVGHMNVAE